MATNKIYLDPFIINPCVNFILKRPAPLWLRLNLTIWREINGDTYTKGTICSMVQKLFREVSTGFTGCR